MNQYPKYSFEVWLIESGTFGACNGDYPLRSSDSSWVWQVLLWHETQHKERLMREMERAKE